MDLRGCSDGVVEALLIKADFEGFDWIPIPSLALGASFVPLSFTEVDVVELPKSSDVPGVLGVFPVDPKDAKAPEPSPKAEEAPFVGDATLVVVKGEIPLNGLDLLLKDPSPPKRFAG